MAYMKNKNLLVILLFIGILAYASGCTPAQVKPVSEELEEEFLFG